jgi:hypothetical protein
MRFGRTPLLLPIHHAVIAAALQAYPRFEPLLPTRFEEFADGFSSAVSNDEHRSS